MKAPRTWISFLLLALLGCADAYTSVVTVTETGQSTVTQTSTSVFAITTTTSICSVASSAVTQSCSNGVWSAGSNYYSANFGGLSLSGATTIRGYAGNPYALCYQFCSEISTCVGANIYHIGAVTDCFLISGTPTVVAAASTMSVIEVLTTRFLDSSGNCFSPFWITALGIPVFIFYPIFQFSVP